MPILEPLVKYYLKIIFGNSDMRSLSIFAQPNIEANSTKTLPTLAQTQILENGVFWLSFAFLGRRITSWYIKRI